MVTGRILNIASFKTASRCWVPVSTKPTTLRHFSSRMVNFHSAVEARVVANDMILSQKEERSNEHETFEATVFSSEEVHPAAPVNKVWPTRIPL